MDSRNPNYRLNLSDLNVNYSTYQPQQNAAPNSSAVRQPNQQRQAYTPSQLQPRADFNTAQYENYQSLQRFAYDQSALGSLAYASSLNQPTGNINNSNAGHNDMNYAGGDSNQRNARSPPVAIRQTPSPSQNMYNQRPARPVSTATDRAHASHNQQPSLQPQFNTFGALQTPNYQPRESQPSMDLNAPGPRYQANGTRAVSHQGTQNTQANQPTQNGNHQPVSTSADALGTSRDQFQRQSLPTPSAPATVEPSQVYDPWQEHQRRAEAALRAEIEKNAAESRKLEEANGNETKGGKDAENANRPKRKRVSGSSQIVKKARTSKQSTQENSNHKEQATATSDALNTAEELEAKMKEMFAQMRELNKQNPELLSKLWQQERENHLQAQAKGKQNKTPVAQPVNKPAASHPNSSISTNHDVSKAQSGRPAVVDNRTNLNQQLDHAKRPLGLSEKKALLAELLVKVLRAMPENRGKSIDIHQMARILDRNMDGGLHYHDLCRGIEALGLRIDKQRFALALNAAVPAPSRRPLNSIPMRTDEAMAEVINGAQRPPAALADVGTRLLQGEPLLDAPKNPTAPPIEMTREVQRSKQKSKQANNVAATVSNPPGRTSHSVVSGGHTGSSHGSLQNGQGQHPNSVYPDPTAPSYRSPYPGVNGNSNLEGLDAIKTFNETAVKLPVAPQLKQRARKQDHKVPMHHPSLPLTKEEMARKKTFADLVDLTSDVSDDEALQTLQRFSNSTSGQIGELDSVERPKLDKSHVSSLPKRKYPQDHPARGQHVVLPIDKTKALRRKTYDPRTIARDILLACGRHPEIRPLNGHLELLRQSFWHVKEHSDLGTLRWDLIDPGGPPPGSGPVQLESNELHIDSSSDSDSVLGPSEPVSVGAAIRVGADDGGNVIFGPVDPVLRMKPGPKPKPKPEPRPRLKPGPKSKPKPEPRPRLKPGPKPKPKPEHIDGLQSLAATGSQRPAGSGDDSRPRQPGSSGPAVNQVPDRSSVPSGQEAPMSYAALRAAQLADGKEVSRRGRPKGWRMSMASSPSQAKQGSPKQSNRAPKEPQPEPEPVYHVYQCQWQACSAQLHNLTTLRKHIHKLHSKLNTNGHFDCLWFGCGEVTTERSVQKMKAKFKVLDFDNIGDWKQHVEDAHIKPIAWQLGDGPVGGLSDHADSELSEAYMSDSQGRRVTPQVIIPLSISAEPSPASAERKKRTVEEKAQETQAALERKKRDIGPGIDRGGATLANEKRRMGFIDDEDIEEIVDEDD